MLPQGSGAAFPTYESCTLAQVAQVDALPTAIGLAAITQQCDTQWLDRLGGGYWVGRSLGLGLSLNCI